MRSWIYAGFNLPINVKYTFYRHECAIGFTLYLSLPPGRHTTSTFSIVSAQLVYAGFNSSIRAQCNFFVRLQRAIGFAQAIRVRLDIAPSVRSLTIWRNGEAEDSRIATAAVRRDRLELGDIALLEL